MLGPEAISRHSEQTLRLRPRTRLGTCRKITPKQSLEWTTSALRFVRGVECSLDSELFVLEPGVLVVIGSEYTVPARVAMTPRF